MTRLSLALLLFCGFPHLAAAQDMPLSQVLIPGQGWELTADGYSFTEGPAVDAAGNLYFTDVRDSQIYRHDTSSGETTLFKDDTQRTNGLMFGPDGRLYGCQNGARRIVAFDQDGKEHTVADDVDCNDLVVTAAGGVYFTDPGNHRVWYVSPGGEKRVVDETLQRPNGIILWPGGGTLVVADTLDEQLWAFRVEADGALTFKEPYYQLRMVQEMVEAGRGSGADGMTVDADGRLYVATHAGLQIFDTTGRMSGVLLKPQRAFLSNVVFAGPKLDKLYVTCSDKVYRRKTKVHGLPSLAAMKK